MAADRTALSEGIGGGRGDAAANRRRFDEAGIFAVNLISSPGAGKTTLVERTIGRTRDWVRPAALLATVAGGDDVERLLRHGVSAIALTTGGRGYLDAFTIAHGLDGLDLSAIDLLFIENVGDLICPATHDLGESMAVVLASVAEGESVALKYPAAFARAGAMVLTKIDLVPYLEFSAAKAIKNARAVNPDLLVFPVSCYTGEGLEAWTQWLAEQVEVRRRRVGRT